MQRGFKQEHGVSREPGPGVGRVGQTAKSPTLQLVPGHARQPGLGEGEGSVLEFVRDVGPGATRRSLCRRVRAAEPTLLRGGHALTPRDIRQYRRVE